MLKPLWTLIWSWTCEDSLPDKNSLGHHQRSTGRLGVGIISHKIRRLSLVLSFRDTCGRFESIFPDRQSVWIGDASVKTPELWLALSVRSYQSLHSDWSCLAHFMIHLPCHLGVGLTPTRPSNSGVSIRTEYQFSTGCRTWVRCRLPSHVRRSE